MTKEKFIEHLLAVDTRKATKEHIRDERSSLPNILQDAIVYAWINKIPENEHTEALREQAIHLWQNEGHFVYN